MSERPDQGFAVPPLPDLRHELRPLTDSDWNPRPMNKPKYHIYISVTTGPHKTPVEIMAYEGRKRAFIDSAALLAALWRSIRLMEKGKVHRVSSSGMTRERWLRIHKNKNSSD